MISITDFLLKNRFYFVRIDSLRHTTQPFSEKVEQIYILRYVIDIIYVIVLID